MALIVSRFQIRLSLPKKPDANHSSDSHQAHEPAHHDTKSHGHGGGDHGHHGGGGSKLLTLGFLIVALIVAVSGWRWIDHLVGAPGHSKEVRRVMAPQGTLPPSEVARLPKTVPCLGEESVAAVIGPGEFIRVHVSSRTRLDFTPKIDTGAISFCSFIHPDQCVLPGKEFRVAEDTFTVTNLSSEDVDFSCWYTPQ